MLTHWSVRNFKSLSGLLEIPLSPISIFCGSNSSGKSSILQSMLLLKQTITSGQRGRLSYLNGPDVKLGSFRNVLSSSAPDGFIELAYEFNLLEDEPKTTIVDRQLGSNYRSPERRGVAQLKRINGSFRWQADPDEPDMFDGRVTISDLNPILSRVVLDIDVWSKDSQTHSISKITLTPPAGHDATERSDIVFYNINEIDDSLKAEVMLDKPKAEVYGCLMNGIMIDDILVRYDQNEYDAQRIVAYLTAPLHHTSSSGGVEKLEPVVLEAINVWLDANNFQLLQGGISQIEPVRRHIASQLEGPADGPASARLIGLVLGDRQLSERHSALLAELRETLVGVLGGRPQKTALDFKTPQAVRLANAYVRDFFQSGVRYLGPLRDSPRAVPRLDIPPPACALPRSRKPGS